MADNPSGESGLKFKKEIKRQFGKSSKDALERLILKRRVDKYEHLPQKLLKYVFSSGGLRHRFTKN